MPSQKPKFPLNIYELLTSKIESFFSESSTGIKTFDPALIRKKGQGFVHDGQEFIHHSDLPHSMTAYKTVSGRQKKWVAIAGFILLAALLINWHFTLVVLIATVIVLYFLDLCFNFILIHRSFLNKPELSFTPSQILGMKDQDLPTYTIFCPLYKEWAVLPQFIQSMETLDYPKNKLQIMLLLEQDDIQSVHQARGANLPKNFEIVVVPHSMPKTKPKAMNYGLKFAKGEYITIYDAEDLPDPDQLKKAVLAFRKLDDKVVCVQCKLNFYNPEQNFVTRLFTAEYSLWFDLVLPGLQSMSAPIPLGGTSNHFRATSLKELQGWDAFNVTEDCDLGVRLAKQGYSTAIIDSTTYEEANSHLMNWYRQRSRWIKGYMQTYLVHMREPENFGVDWKDPNLYIFQLVVGGKIFSMFMNPFLWAITAIYFLFRVHVATFIEPFFPNWVLYLGTFSLVFGNFLYLYYYMIGLAKRGYDGLIKYTFLVPFYWLAMSAAAWQALYEIIVKPHYWAKTVHGLHLDRQSVDEEAQGLAVGNLPLTPLAAASYKYDLPKAIVADIKVLTSEISSVTKKLESVEFVIKKVRSLNVTPSFVVQPPVMSLIEEEVTEVTKVSRFEEYKIRIKTLMTGNIGAGSMLIFSTLLANFLNFLFNAILGRSLTLADFATVTLFNTVLNISAVLLNALTGAVTYKTAYLVGQNKALSSEGFANQVKKGVWWTTGSLSIIWVLAIPFFAKFFNVSSNLLILSFTPVIAFGSIAAVQSGYLRGRFEFALVGWAIVLEALSKTIIAVFLVWAGEHTWASLSIPLSILISFGANWFFVLRIQKQDAEEFDKTIPRTSEEAFPSWMFGASIVNGLANTIYLNCDVLLAKHYLDPTSAGAYSLLSLVGKMVYLMGTLLSPFVASVVSRHEGAGTNSKKDFSRLLYGTAIVSAVSFLVAGYMGRFLVPWLFGPKSLPIVPYLLPYCLAMALFAICTTVISYHIIKKRYSFSLLMLASSIFLICGIIASHNSIANFSYVMMLSGILSFVLVFTWHFLSEKTSSLYSNFGDFLNVFAPFDPNPQSSSGKRILIFNWRDTMHAYAGGAEVYVHELAKRWVDSGNSVTVFCGNDQKNLGLETVDGVNIVRRGGFYMVYFWAFIYYRLKFRGKYDVIVDCQNGIPFFTPLYAKEKVYCLMHHVHQEVFHRSLPKFAAIFASILENTLMPMVYANTKFITVSNSSKIEMQEQGLGLLGVEIVHPGVDLENLEPGKKYNEPLVVYLGRLKAYKSVDVLLRAFQQVAAKLPNAKLVIAGDGEERGNLEKLTDELEIGDKVAFAGKISERKKITLLKRAWVFCNPSMMEGWGITTIEANACGVPVVAANVPGLRDSVQNPHTGYLVEHGNVDDFAYRILEILVNPDLHNSMKNHSLKWAQNFDWSKSANKALEIISEEE